MGIRCESIDQKVRAEMLRELEMDMSRGRVYISPRLTPDGVQAWPKLLNDAFANHSDDWIVSALGSQSLLRTTEPRTVKGKTTMAKVPYTAAETLAEGEFNRYYARGLCACVIAEGGTEVEVMRGKQVAVPRPESQMLIGKRLPASRLLDDLRASIGVDTVLGLPPGPNSGLTVRRVRN